MSESPKKVEREVEAHRRGVAETIDELKEKLTVGQLTDQVWNYVRDGNGRQMADNFGRQVRDNPLPLALIGAGLAWMAFGDSAKAQADRLRDKVGDWYDSDRADRDDAGSHSAGAPRYRDPLPPAPIPAGGIAPTGTTSGSPDHTRAGQDGLHRPPPSSVGSNTSQSVTDRAREGLESSKDKARNLGASAQDLASSAKERLAQTGQSMSDAVSSAAEHARQTGADWAQEARETYEDYQNRLHAQSRWAAERGRYYGRSMQRSFTQVMQEEPLILGAVAVAIGAAVGAMLPATRQEHAWMGPARDAVRDHVSDRASDLADTAIDKGKELASGAAKVVQSTVSQAAGAADKEADRQGLKPPSRSEAVAKAKEATRTAVSTAAEEAKTAGSKAADQSTDKKR